MNKKTHPLQLTAAILAAIIVVHIGSRISLLSQHDVSVSDYYLPTALGVIIVYWFGPWVAVPAMYINAVLTSVLWGIPAERWPLWFVYALPETLFVFLSWLFFKRVYKGQYWLPDINNTLAFLLLGIFLPTIIEVFLLQSVLVYLGDQDPATFWLYVTSNLLSELTTTFTLILPVLFYVSPFLSERGLILDELKTPQRREGLRKRDIFELTAIFAALLGLTFVLEFRQYWYIYGFFSLYVAIRFGFGPAILTNSFIVIVAYVLPKLGSTGAAAPKTIHDVTEIFLGGNFLFLFAAITGRVISDIRLAQATLLRQNLELEQTNRELDRFAYSVSHDLSAPLKSIRGLVNVSRLTQNPDDYRGFLDRIERSVIKLEAFITEVLDYSRNRRQELNPEPIQVNALLDEVIENQRLLPDFGRIKFSRNIEESLIYEDKVRLTLILNALISNAVGFQKHYDEHSPVISISAFRRDDYHYIRIADNGQGIRSEHLPRIFDMFYRANERASGSGLGLYIAREAASRIRAEISVQSTWGEGSVFEVRIPARD